LRWISKNSIFDNNYLNQYTKKGEVMKQTRFLSAVALLVLLIFIGCGSSSGKKTTSPHPGETVEQAKARYLETIKSTNSDLNLSNTIINDNLIALAECIYNKNPSLSNDDIIATFGAGVQEGDVNETINCDSYAIRTVGGTFQDSLNVLYYSINNPVTDNEQLLAYDYESGEAHVVNTNVILGDRVFLFEGEKDGDKVKFTGKRYGIFLDPNQEFETRTVQGRYGPSTYKFFSNNALMKFNVRNPTNVESFFNSSQIPSGAGTSGLSKLGAEFTVVENIVDPDNSYIGLKAFDSLADDIAGETSEEKLQADITVRVGDKKSVLGKPIAIIKDTDMKTASVLVSEAAAFIPSVKTGSYILKRYDPTLSTAKTIASGEYHFATQNDTHIYLFKEGSNKLYALAKENGDNLVEVTGITLAGNYDYSIHANGAKHGSSTQILNGSSTLSGRNTHLGKGDDAYVAFHYDLHPNAVKSYIFGAHGNYKSVQVFKLTGTSGVKLMDNGDGVDDSANPRNDEKIKGHINLIVASDNRLYAEIGWWDGNTTEVGGSCTEAYSPRAGVASACQHVKYGYLDTSVDSASDITTLTFGGEELVVNNLPYYVSRRIAPVSVDGILYISTFKGGTRATGYEYAQYQYSLDNGSEIKSVDGRTYFTKTHESMSGDFGGRVIAWDKNTQMLFDAGSKATLANTASINGKPGYSISALTNGVPLAGVGSLAMLKNNEGGHKFALFSVDTENGGLKYIDFAPYGGWIYE